MGNPDHMLGSRRHLAAVAMLTALAAGCAGGRARPSADVRSSITSTTALAGAATSSSSPGAVGSTPTGGPGAGSHSPGRSSTPTTGTAGGPGATPSGSSASSTPPRPLLPGTYRYDTSGQSTVSGGATGTTSYPPVTTLVADPPQGARQHLTRDLRDAHGNGTVVETTETFEPDGVHLDDLKTTTTSAGISQQQAFQPSPAPLVLPTGAHPGTHLQFTMSNSTITAKVTIDVVGTQQLVVGGTVVDALVVRTVTDLSGEVTGRTASDASVVPDHDLTVKEHVVADGQVGLDSFHSDYTATAQRLSPR